MSTIFVERVRGGLGQHRLGASPGVGLGLASKRIGLGVSGEGIDGELEGLQHLQPD